MEIQFPESEQLMLDDCRRLTGPSMVWDKPGAILDILVEDLELDAVLECWYRHIHAVLAQLDCGEPALSHRRFENGFNLLIEAPLDQLYSAVLTLETAWYFCACELLEVEVEEASVLIEELRQAMREEANPGLIDMQQAAQTHQVDFLADDEILSIGRGAGSVSWDIEDIPAPGEVDWTSVRDVPVALITGTNGKSTSVRLLDAIARAAQQVSGVTSTDFVRVGDDVLDRGDYSGPGGARLLLRDKRLQVAFLEVARGGILRRGLPIKRATAALVTNIARDHLGQYGVNTLKALTEVKLVVRKTLAVDAVLVLNADDSNIVDYLDGIEAGELCWFSLDKNNPLVQQQLAGNGRCCFAEAGEIVYHDGSQTHRICKISDIPLTLAGAALHNVRNVLGAVGIAAAMNYSFDQIRQGLFSFHSDAQDNPGRLNSFDLDNGARVIVDFAHNAHSVEAVVDTVKRMPARKRWAMFGSAGDRSDEEIAAIAKGVCALEPDYVVIVEIENYLRGRAPGEVSELLRQACLDSGLKPLQMHFAGSPLAGAQLTLTQMQAGDLGLLLVLDQRDQVFQAISEH